jgi:putative membrane protein
MLQGVAIWAWPVPAAFDAALQSVPLHRLEHVSFLLTAVAAQFGLTPLEDQQLAGLVMWIPAGLVYTLAALLVAARWISSPGERLPGPAWTVPRASG